MRMKLGLIGLVASSALLVFLALRSQVALLKSGHSDGGPIYSGLKTERYSGWKLVDDEFKNPVDPQNARVVFYIMVAGLQELPGLDALLRNLYHVDHFFLVHLDKAAVNVRDSVKSRIQAVLDERGIGERNIRFVEPSKPVTWGGFTMTLNAVYGLTQALHWTTKWDYFINLSASDLPLLRTEEIAGILGEHKASNTSFIKGFKYEPSWEGYKFVDRREMFAEDEAVMRETEHEKRWPWAILDAQKEMLTRPVPNLFTVHKGEFWVMLHRSMAEYVHKSPDNQARVLLAYFSGMMVSDEEFFQTVACNPYFPHDTLRTHNDNLRFVNWWGDQASPAVVPPFRAVAAANSGSLFGRKFSSSTDEGRDGIRWLENYLADSSRSEVRVDRVKRRLAARMSPEGEPVGFCGKAQEKKPPEAYFAVAGQEEVLPVEYELRPPRRGAGGGGESESEGQQAQQELVDSGAHEIRGGGGEEGVRRRRLSGEVLAAIAAAGGARFEGDVAARRREGRDGDREPETAAAAATTSRRGWSGKWNGLGEGHGRVRPETECMRMGREEVVKGRSGDTDAEIGSCEHPAAAAAAAAASAAGAGAGASRQEEDEDADEALAGEGGIGGEDVQLQGDSSRADLNPLKAVNTPIPRVRTMGAIRPPDYFRTQYLSNLGIWATKQAEHLNSAPRTEARYKSNIGPETPRNSSTTANSDEPLPIPPPRIDGRVDLAPSEEATDTPSSDTPPGPQHEEGAEQEEEPPRLSSPPSTGTARTAGAVILWPRVTKGRDGGIGVVARAAEANAEADAKAAEEGEGEGEGGGEGVVAAGLASRVAIARSSFSCSSSSLDDEAGAGTGAGAADEAPAATAVAVAVAALGRKPEAISRSTSGGGGGGATQAKEDEVVLRKNTSCSYATTTAAASSPSSAAATAAATLGTAAASASESTNESGNENVWTRRDKQAHQAAYSPSAPASAPVAINPPPPGATPAPSSTASASSSTSSSPPPSSSRIADRSVADPIKVGSPPLRAVKPPRRDIRRAYLTNLGMKSAVVAGPGGTRTPPPILRRSSFIQSVENPVEEQLKDPSAGEITFEGVLRVVGSILTGGGGNTKKDREPRPRPCRTCERLRKSAGTRGASSSPPSARAGGGLGDYAGGGQGEPAVGVGGDGDVVELAPCRHKHVDFAPVVSAVYVPVHSEYSDRVRRSYWNSAGEIREMVYRNMLEFDAEEYNWRNVAEEEDMYFCEETGEYIHPTFFNAQEEAREVRATSSSATSSDPDAEDHHEYINEGRRMPVMQQR
eukprot:g5484.t1